jgi:hypothetical protein
MVTEIELRMFCESLPEETLLRGRPSSKRVSLADMRPTKRVFASECGVSYAHLVDIIGGKRALAEPTISKMLPVMRKYGFGG